MEIQFTDEKFEYHCSDQVYENLGVKDDPTKVKEYFIILMSDIIKDREVKIEQLTNQQEYLVQVGNGECYLIQQNRIYKCNSFTTLKSKFLQNCSTSLSNMIDLTLNK
ncbi:unnamed protein product [Paramecium sonneborni]|uniref:Uncharacterized protein n=1 Tax=Paramecium sonneborni TaxID=65129 RepID=A0A8S1QU83_9CILI|nr:unnamed protein product [Paramecium sonneborni]CAD8118973.1 unnamed protein product [Paramecium sonneborni]